ncbi:MAG: hypothetical protein Q4A06_10765, partial [Cardiobacteriaceae bacterium]|nr:hypothetical protein [Cardiobacteriaceae bacterium]
MHLVVKRFVLCIQPVSAMNGRPTIAARRWAKAHPGIHENIFRQANGKCIWWSSASCFAFN